MTAPSTAEVVVIGAGIVGASVCRELAVRGVETCLLDRGPIAGGTTGLGEGNILCADKEPGPELELARHGQWLYHELEERLGGAIGLRRRGALVIYPTDPEMQAGAAHAARMAAAGVTVQVIDGVELRELEPELAGDLAGAAFFPEDMQCDAASVAREMAREASAAGARILTGAGTARIVVESGRVTRVESDRAWISCDAAVVATGAWSAALADSAGLSLPVAPRKGQLLMTEPAAMAVRYKLLDGSYTATVSAAAADLQLATVLETTVEGNLLVGSSRELRGFDTTVDPDVSAAIFRRAMRLLPGLADVRVTRAWAGLRPFLPDHRPAIGQSTLVGGLWAATGHEGAGVGLGPITGRLIAQAYCGDATAVDLAPFAVDRFAGVGGT